MKVTIIGAGVGGLATALFLKEKGQWDIEIYEKSKRIGGRIKTSRFETVPVKYEAGAAELYRINKDPNLENLVDDLRLSKVEMKGFPTVVMGGEIIRDQEGIHRLLGEKTAQAVERFLEKGKKIRPQKEFAGGGTQEDNNHPWIRKSFRKILSEIQDKRAERYLAIKAHCDVATEPNKTHGLFGFDNLLIDETDYCQLYSLTKGNEELISALERKLSGVLINKGATLKRVEKSGKRFKLTLQKDQRNEEIFTDILILNLAHNHLSKIEYEDGRLNAKMQELIKHYDHDTHYTRVTILFKKKFWREVFGEDYFVLDSFLGCCVYDESARKDTGQYGVLSWLISGGPAWELAKDSDREVVKEVLRSLPKSLLSLGRNQFIEGRVDRWVRGVSAIPGGTTIKGDISRYLPDTESPNFFVVGDYMTDTTINGVLGSVKLVTEAVHRKFYEGESWEEVAYEVGRKAGISQ